MNRNINSIIFDFDFTLADSSAPMAECVNYALEGLGLDWISHDRMCECINLPFSTIFARFAGNGDSNRYGEFCRLFDEMMTRIYTSHTVLFNGVPETLQFLKQQGLVLGIVSSQNRSFIEPILSGNNCLDLFDIIVGWEDVTRHKPDPAGLRAAMDRLNGSPRQTVYVGDSPVDAETALRTGTIFVGINSGIAPDTDFNSYPAAGIIDGISELPELINGLRLNKTRSLDLARKSA